MRIRIPGEYYGSEDALPPGVFPELRMQASARLRKYLREHIKLNFDGIEKHNGIIGHVEDEATGLVDEVATIGDMLTIRGKGLKLDSDEAHKDIVGIFFTPVLEPGGLEPERSLGGKSLSSSFVETAEPVKVSIIGINAPRTLKIIVPHGLKEGTAYQISVITQVSLKHSCTLLKEARKIQSKFALTAK
jgi:hypothetical protein